MSTPPISIDWHIHPHKNYILGAKPKLQMWPHVVCSVITFQRWTTYTLADKHLTKQLMLDLIGQNTERLSV